jgi:hypothetical protein
VAAASTRGGIKCLCRWCLSYVAEFGRHRIEVGLLQHLRLAVLMHKHPAYRQGFAAGHIRQKKLGVLSVHAVHLHNTGCCAANLLRRPSANQCA